MEGGSTGRLKPTSVVSKWWSVNNVTEPGWYPDPWDTGDERYFDGSAWTRQVRAPDGDESSEATPTIYGTVPPADQSPAGGSSDDHSAPEPVRSEAPVPPSDAAARTDPRSPGPALDADWYADPRGEAQWRWWDGAKWTGFTDRTVGETTVVSEVEAERRWARWARVAVTLNPVFQIAGVIGGAIQSRWIAQNLQELTDGARPPTTIPALGWLSFAGLGVLVVLILWLYRAGVTARRAGQPLRRSPVLGAIALIIPILNLWWPYRAARDALGNDHPQAQLVVRWWALYLTSSLAGIVVLFAGFAPLAVTYLVVVAAAGFAVGAAVVGRELVSAMLTAHEGLAAAERAVGT